MLHPRVAAIVIREKKILLVGRCDLDFLWTPGGKVEPGEDHHDALAREMKEELGVVLERSRHYLSYKTMNEATGEDQEVHCYLAEFSCAPVVGDGISTYRFVAREDLEKRIRISSGIRVNLIPKLISDNLI
jgi:ADP-ribose pyrophosphatase YjhB (NUDIX family)